MIPKQEIARKLELEPDQEKLIIETVQKNPKTIVVLLNGSPIAMEHWIDKVPAILEGWYPGMYGGDVLADTLLEISILQANYRSLSRNR